MTLTRICDSVIRIGFYLLFILVPLVLTPWNYELFEYNKMMVTYALTAIVMTAWIMKMIVNGKAEIAKTPLDLPIGLFVASQFFSTIFSIDPHVSWFGYYSRFNGGFWSVISYVLLYYAFVSNWTVVTAKTTEASEWRIPRLLRITLVTGVIVATYGFLERLGIDKHIWVQDVQNRVFSTLGQPNWLAAYLAALLPPAIMSAALSFVNANDSRNGRLPRLTPGFLVWTFVSFLFFTVLIFTRSRSGLFGFLVGDALICGVILLSHKKRTFLTPLSIIHVLFFLFVFINGSYIAQFDTYFTLNGLAEKFSPKQTALPTATKPETQSGTLLETGITESGDIRKHVWKGAITAWRSEPKTVFIGTGTETFAFAFFRYKPAEHNMTSEWDFLYNKAHNEYLNYLTTTGMFGLAAFLFFIARTAFTTYSLVKREKSIEGNLTELALFAGWVTILVTNFFGFSVVIVQLLFFLIPAILVVRIRNHAAESYQFPIGPVPKSLEKPIRIGVLVAGGYLVFVLIKFWYADIQFAEGYRLSRAGQYNQAYSPIITAVFLNPKEPLYHDELGQVYAGLSTLAIDNGQATAGAELARKSIAESDTAVTISPRNVNFWKTRTKIYYAFSTYNTQFIGPAIEALTQAATLSPLDPKIYYNLAILYGRNGEAAKAIEFMQKAITAKPNYRDPYYGLFVFYQEEKNTEKAKEILTEYLSKVDPKDADFQEKLKQL